MGGTRQVVDIKLFTVKFFQLCCMFEIVNNEVFVKSLFGDLG